jgi:hypothetical protein
LKHLTKKNPPQRMDSFAIGAAGFEPTTPTTPK